MPLVSVIIPAYNQSRYLGQAVQSVLDQTYPDFEVVIVDDGSTDDTPRVARGFSDPRVRYVHQSNRGLSAARNTGICASSGPFLTFLDSDDLFLPEKLALLVAELERHPSIGLVAGGAVLIDQNGQRTGHTFESELPADCTQLLLGNPLHVGSVLLRRQWQARVGLFDESLRSYEDWDLWLRLARAGCPMRSIDRPVSLYRFHGAQMTRDGSQMTAASFAVLDKIFTDPQLPESWRSQRDRAYSNAHLRAAAHSYLVQDFSSAQHHLLQAVALNPGLLADRCQPLAQHFAAWIELPKAHEPLAFLHDIYTHLPPGLAELSQRRNRELAQAAMKLAFEAHRQGRRAQARAAIWQAVHYQPRWLANRGVLSILFQSYRPTRNGAVRAMPVHNA